VVVGTRVGSADHHDDEVRVFPDHRISNRRLEKMPVLVDLFLKIERIYM